MSFPPTGSFAWTLDVVTRRLTRSGSGTRGGRLHVGMRWRVPSNNSSAFQRLSRLLPLHWYVRNAICQQMLPTHDDAPGIRMDAASNFNLWTKRHYTGVNPVSLERNSFVYRNHAELLSSSTPAQYSLSLKHWQLGFKALKVGLYFKTSSVHYWRPTEWCTCCLHRDDKTVYFWQHKATTWGQPPGLQGQWDFWRLHIHWL